MTKKKSKPKESKTLTKIQEKRLIILKDAIKQIKAEKYLAISSNGFVRGGIESRVDLLHESCSILDGKDTSKEELNKHLDKLITKNNPCEVCAKGAILLSSIRKFNNFSVAKAYNGGLDNWADLKARNFLGRKNADLIEHYFEHDYVNSDPEYKLLDKWYETYPNANDRLIAIFKNCIKNKSIFKPEQLK